MTKSKFVIRRSQRPDFELTTGQQQVQALAADARQVVYGSPGSGKTSALIQLYLHQIKSGNLQPEQVLALAGSREAANLLRDELALRFQGATSGPMARTLASFAFQILRQHSLDLGEVEPELISGSEQDRILAEIIAELDGQNLQALGWPSHITSAVIGLKGFRSELRDLVTVCLEHQIDPQELIALGNQHQRKDWVAASTLLDRYLQRLREPGNRHRHDSSTLLDVAARVLTGSRSPLVDQLKLVLIDDAQELTPAAQRLIRAIVGSGVGLVLFGDPDTATLSFRGADASAMANLMRDLGANSQPIILRSPAGLRPLELSKALGNISFKLESNLAGPQRRDYVAEISEPQIGQVIEAKILSSTVAETAWLGRRLRELHIREGVPWSEMAIVARSRPTLELLAASLAAEEVPVAIRGSRSALRDEHASAELLNVVHLATLGRQLTLHEVVRLIQSPYCGIDSVGLRRLRRALRRQELEADGQRTSDELLLDIFNAPGSVATIKTREGITLDRFVRNFISIGELAKDGANIETLLWMVWAYNAGDKDRAPKQLWYEQSQRIDEVGAQINRNLDAVTELFSAANRFVERNPEAQVREFIDQQLNLELPEDSLALNYRDDNRIALITPSALIGKRYRVVALPHLQEGLWPNLKPRTSLLGALSLDAIRSGKTDEIEENFANEEQGELRMLHKAVGAASEKLIISAIDAEDEQVSSFVQTILTRIPETDVDYSQPRFTLRGMVGDLRRRLVESQDVHERISIAYALAQLAVEGEAGANPRDWYGLLGISTEEPLVSTDSNEEQVWLLPSQLQDFLTCPLHWFLNNNGGKDQTFEANLGSLLHTILEEEDGQSEAELWQMLDDRWGELTFEAGWLSAREKRRAKRMLAAMSAYLDASRRDQTKVLGREVEFAFEYNGAMIRGTVDRIEQQADGQIVIVDLKTGTPISKEEALLHPQLGVYQMAFEHGAFDEILPADAKKLGGAKLLFLGAGKVDLREQPSIQDNIDIRASLEEMVAEATTEMAMPRLVLSAQVGTHCSVDNNYSNCKLHLVKAVTYGG